MPQHLCFIARGGTVGVVYQDDMLFFDFVQARVVTSLCARWPTRKYVACFDSRVFLYLLWWDEMGWAKVEMQGERASEEKVHRVAREALQ